MSTVTLSPSGSTTPAPTSYGVAHTVTFGRLVRAEWIKVLSQRSTWWMLSLAVIVHAGLPFLFGLLMQVTDESGPGMAGGDDSWSFFALGVSMSVFLVVVFAAMQITGEYRTGLVRSSFTADPRRIPTLGAKAVVVSVCALIVGVLGTALAWLTTLPFSNTLGLDLSLTDAEAWRLMFGPTIYLVGWALFSLAIGGLIRSTAATLSVVIAYLLILDGILMIVPFELVKAIYPYLPGPASAAVTQSAATGEMAAAFGFAETLPAWQGLGVFAIWVVLAFVGASLLVRLRDA